ncbi:ATP-binding protein [Pantoea sp. y20]
MDLIRPGMHSSFRIDHFNEQEKKIIDVLSKEFYLTNGGETIRLSENSIYRYILIRPTNVYQDMFNLNREIVVLFSPYEKFQSRTLDAFSIIYQRTSSLRVDKTCNILISMDRNIESNLLEIVKSEPEAPTIIPFRYSEVIHNPSDSYFFRNRFQENLYNRDLFSFEAPLKKDIFFFGRSDIILSIVSKLKDGNNAGLFGLRKTGKTSLINAIERNLKSSDEVVTVIDCQDPSFNKRRWNESLHYICARIVESNNLSIAIPNESDFDEKNASLVFDSFLKKINDQKNKRIYIIFDEIENISINTSPSENWKSGMDFVYFWQSLRTIFQKKDSCLAYMIVGTNPSCIEVPRINGTDNPIFNHLTPQYIPGFDLKSTREMIRKLGKRMGINFDESIYSNINDDFGGHPFLIRKICSIVSSNAMKQRKPVTIGKVSYRESKVSFKEKNSAYLDMILGVLREQYPDEYQLLQLLANGDDTEFKANVSKNYSSMTHLIGYGILGKDNGSYYFLIDSMRDYLLEVNKYQKKETSLEQRWAEISERRNHAERELRKIIKRTLTTILGEEQSKALVLDILGGARKNEYSNRDLGDLFNPNKSNIFFEDLRKIVSKHWEYFKNVFSNSKQSTFESLGFINEYRAEAHAKEIASDEFLLFRISMTKIELDIERYNN